MRKAWLLSCGGCLGLSLLTFCVMLFLLVQVAPLFPQDREKKPVTTPFELSEPPPRPSLTHPPPPVVLVSGARLTAEQRQQRLRERLNRACDGALEAGQVAEFTVDQSQGATVVRSEKEVLATVLPEDLPEYAPSLASPVKKQLEAAIAGEWCENLQVEADMDYTMRQPAFRHFVLMFAAVTFLLALAYHGLISYFARRVMHSPAWSLKILVWVSWLALLLNLVPEARDLGDLVTVGFLRPLFVLFIVGLGSAVAMAVGTFLIRRYLHGYRATAANQGLRFDTRMATVEAAALFGLRLVIVLLAVMSFLSQMDLDLGAIAAGAGVFGAVFGWVAQDTIRDLIAGLIIVFEDQFGVGDYLDSPLASGAVESFNLRRTRLRGSDGGVATVPNNDLRRVKNLSNEWSQVDFRVSIGHGSDVEEVLRALEEEARGLAHEWADRIQGEPKMLGVQELRQDGVTLRLQLRTLPLQRDEVRRELNRRVKLRLDKENTVW